MASIRVFTLGYFIDELASLKSFLPERGWESASSTAFPARYSMEWSFQYIKDKVGTRLLRLLALES